MAGLALSSVASLVPLILVILAVASNTCFRRTLVFLVEVAFPAGDIGMLAADQTEV